VRIDPGDLRFKEFKHRSGVLFIFAIDASGRWRLTDGAQRGADSIVAAGDHRDKVALISFRGTIGSVAAPTRSAEFVRRLQTHYLPEEDACFSRGGKGDRACPPRALRGTSRCWYCSPMEGRMLVWATVARSPARSNDHRGVDETWRLAWGGRVVRWLWIRNRGSSRTARARRWPVCLGLGGLAHGRAAAVYDAATITRRPSEN
jgi:hypothetical protein